MIRWNNCNSNPRLRLAVVTSVLTLNLYPDPDRGPHVQERMLKMKRAASVKIKTMHQNHEAILEGTNSLKVLEMPPTTNSTLHTPQPLNPSIPQETYVKEMEVRRKMVAEHGRLTARYTSARDEVAELNGELTALQETCGKLQRKLLLSRGVGKA